MKTETTPAEFILRTYTKDELARLYLPSCARSTALKKFNRWIRYSPLLWGRLQETGVKISTREYTPPDK
ncbi:MAG: DUF4248 domain-containing protein [Bacteroides sp.]|nr:DUF4248 domain-containing protein [Bacteroides sp.]